MNGLSHLLFYDQCKICKNKGSFALCVISGV
jgi:hypothetical protein